MASSHSCTWWRRRSPWSTSAWTPIIIIILWLLAVVQDSSNSLAGQCWGAWDTVFVLYPAVPWLMATGIHPEAGLVQHVVDGLANGILGGVQQGDESRAEV